MKAFDRRVFLAMRELARARARSSPRVWKEYKRNRKSRTGGASALPAWFARLFWPLMLTFLVNAVSPGRVSSGLVLAMLALYCSGTTLLRAAALRNRLYSSHELVVALHYPLPDAEFFRWQVRVWAAFHFSLFLVSTEAYLVVVVRQQASADLLSWALLCALAQVAIAMAISLSQLLWLPRIWAQPALAFYALIAAILFYPRQLAPVQGAALSFLPASWINLWFAPPHLSAGKFLVMFGSIGLLVVLDVRLIRLLGTSYPRVGVSALMPECVNEDERTSFEPDESPDAFSRDYVIARERYANLRSREILEAELAKPGIDWATADWSTRLAGRWLTPRERIVVGLLSPRIAVQWKTRSKRALQLMLGGLLLCAIPLAVPVWLPVGIFSLAGILGAHVFGGQWPGLTVPQIHLGRMQLAVGYPVGYMEASIAMMKLNAVRLLTFTPFGVAAGLLLGLRYLGDSFSGFLLALQVMVIALAAQPYGSLARHSVGTNDTKSLNRTSLVLLLGAIVNVVLFGLVAAFFLAENRTVVAWTAGPILLFLLSLSMWRFYGFLYSRRQIDLLPAIK